MNGRHTGLRIAVIRLTGEPAARPKTHPVWSLLAETMCDVTGER